MKKITKKKRLLKTLIHQKKTYNLDEGVTLLKKMALSKFIESLDVAIKLGIDPKKTDQNIRNAITLPYGTGRLTKIAVFTQGKNEIIAKNCGAEFVGLHDLIEEVKNKKIFFDIAIATPDVMYIVSQIGPILGPRGLMPNPKLGTVTEKLEHAIKDAKSGKIYYKNDKNGIIHTTIGKINFENEKIKANFNSLINSLKKSKPIKLKGSYIKKIIISTTMSPGIQLELNTFHI